MKIVTDSVLVIPSKIQLIIWTKIHISYKKELILAGSPSSAEPRVRPTRSWPDLNKFSSSSTGYFTVLFQRGGTLTISPARWRTVAVDGVNVHIFYSKIKRIKK